MTELQTPSPEATTPNAAQPQASATPEQQSPQTTKTVDEIALELWNEAEKEAGLEADEQTPGGQLAEFMDPKPEAPKPEQAADPVEGAEFNLQRFRELVMLGDTDQAFKLAGIDTKKVSPGEWAQYRHHTNALKQRESELGTLAQNLSGQFQHFYNVQKAIDGGDYVGAIEAMFPEREWSKVSERIVNQSMNRDPQVAELARWKREREEQDRQQQEAWQRQQQEQEAENTRKAQHENVKQYVAVNLGLDQSLTASPLYDAVVQNIVGLGQRVIQRTGRDVTAQELKPQILRDMIAHRAELEKFISAFGGAGGGAPNPQTVVAVQPTDTRVSREPTSIPQSKATGASGATQRRSDKWSEEDDLDAIKMFDGLDPTG